MEFVDALTPKKASRANVMLTQMKKLVSMMMFLARKTMIRRFVQAREFVNAVNAFAKVKVNKNSFQGSIVSVTLHFVWTQTTTFVQMKVNVIVELAPAIQVGRGANAIAYKVQMLVLETKQYVPAKDMVNASAESVNASKLMDMFILVPFVMFVLRVPISIAKSWNVWS